ncbi:nuclear transport factor 2 family protein [Streptomycetaceae bacterium NBC_01309]
MASCVGATGVLTALLDDWQQAFNSHRPADVAALFSEDALFQGISPQLGREPQEIIEYYSNVPPDATARAEVIAAVPLGDGIVHGFADVAFTAPGRDVHRVRLSIVAEQVAQKWLIRQYHAATHQ